MPSKTTDMGIMLIAFDKIGVTYSKSNISHHNDYMFFNHIPKELLKKIEYSVEIEQTILYFDCKGKFLGSTADEKGGWHFPIKRRR